MNAAVTTVFGTGAGLRGAVYSPLAGGTYGFARVDRVGFRPAAGGSTSYPSPITDTRGVDLAADNTTMLVVGPANGTWLIARVPLG